MKAYPFNLIMYFSRNAHVFQELLKTDVLKCYIISDKVQVNGMYQIGLCPVRQMAVLDWLLVTRFLAKWAGQADKAWQVK